MSDQRRQRRGRPKGSGINDWERLLTIASVMEKDPKLKVTTAIKLIGFTDPSVIRRLRDKFKANRDVLLRSTRPARISSPKAVAAEYQRAKSYRSGNISNSNDNQHPRSAVTDYIAMGNRSFALIYGFQADMMRCLLQHPGKQPAIRQPHVVSPGLSASFRA